MKVKSTGGGGNYHTVQQQNSQTQKHHQQSMMGGGQYVMSSSSQKDKTPSKPVLTGIGPAQKLHQQQQQQLQAASAAKAQMQAKQASVTPFAQAGMHPSQQIQGQVVGLQGVPLGPITMAELQQHAQNAIQQTPGQMKNSVKTVNLSFNGMDFAHRNMSASMQNGFQMDNKQGVKQNHSKSNHDHRFVSASANQHPNSYPPHQQQQYTGSIGNTGSLRSLGVGGAQHRQPQIVADQHQTGSGGNQNGSNFSSTAAAQGVFTTLQMHHGTPGGQKKNVSSKNQQRRKITSTNQSAQFSANQNNMLLQGHQSGATAAVNYPQSMKKKSSKAKMLVASDGSGVPVLQGATTAQQQQQIMMARTQNSKINSMNSKGSRPGEIDDASYTGEMNNLFLQEHSHNGVRMNNTMGRGQDNIFAIAQAMQQMQGGGVQTPNGYKHVQMLNSNEHQQYTQGGNMRAKTLAPTMGSLQMQMLPNGQQAQLISAQASAKMNKNYMKGMPQYEMVVGGQYASKSQQRSYQSLQAQQLSLLNQAAVINGGPMQATSPQPQLNNQQIQPQQVQHVQAASQQAAFVYGRKHGGMKPDQQIVMTNGHDQQVLVQGKLQPQQLQSSYHRAAQFDSAEAMAAAVVTQQQQQMLAMGSATNQQKQTVLLNQGQIQYVTREPSGGQGHAAQQVMTEQYMMMSNGQGHPVLVQQQAQTSQKNTNLIVRIDNSNAANHQITKRKRLKDGGTMPMQPSAFRNNGAPGYSQATALEANESEQQSNDGHSQRRAAFIENIDASQLPAFINEQASREAMANSQQNFNSYQLVAGNVCRNGNIGTHESVAEYEGSGATMELQKVERQSSRNTDRYNGGKPSSAVANSRQQHSAMRPDQKQGQGVPTKKQFDQELAARDALIGIDDEEIADHHQDFSEAEGESQLSGGNHSNDEQNNLQFNKSVDSDKIGQSGSFSQRQGANLKLSQQNSAQQQVQPNATTGQQQQPRQADSDVESEQSASATATQHQMFLYSTAAAVGPREANGSHNNLASDSETDGNFSDTGSQFSKRGTNMREDGAGGPGDHHNIDGISEHSSDEADSDSEPDGDPLKKKIKALNEQKPKRKKKKTQDEKVEKKKVKVDKDGGGSKSIVKNKEKQSAAPAKKNFTEVKEKEYTKNKTKGNDVSTKAKAATQAAKDKQKPEKGGEKAAKGASEGFTKIKKYKQPEESKGAATAAGELKESPAKKKPKQKLNLALIHCQPKNIEEQKVIFFDNDCNVNPVFEYENYAATLKFLAQFKEPSDELLDLSKRILNSFIEIYGSESSYLETEGDIVSKEETYTTFTDYMEALGFEDLLTVQFKVNQVAPTSVTHDPKTCKSRVNIRDPPEYRRGRLFGVIDHEIGTHFMRKFNERFQVWHKKRDKYEMKSCIQTEEGFACVNQLVRSAWEGKHPFLYRSALNYYAAYMSSKLSFVELFNDIEKYIDSRPSRWKFVLRLKRGMVETVEPGGLYKDQCYLEGAVYFLKNRHTIDIIGLFTGKISLEDLARPKIQKVLNKENIKLPTFVADMDKYMSALDVIARTNLIDTLPD